MGNSEGSSGGGGYGGQNSGEYCGHNSGGGGVSPGGSFGGRPREPAGPSVKKCCLHTELCRMLDPRNELKLLLSNSLLTLEKKPRGIVY